MPTEPFAPLSAIAIPDSVSIKLQRQLTITDSETGIFRTREDWPEPVGSHQLELEFFSPEEADLFWEFYEKIKGAWKSFWLPSFNQDFLLVDPVIAADAVDLTFRSFNYTTRMFPDEARKHLAFMTGPNAFVKRDIVASVDNNDGTETITINEALGTEFTQQDGTLISFLWYCRLSDDEVEIVWSDIEGGHTSLSVMEVKDAPAGGSGDSSTPIPNCPAVARVPTGAAGRNSGDFAASENSTPVSSVWRFEETYDGLGNWQWTSADDISSGGGGGPLTAITGRLRFYTGGLSFVPPGSTSIARQLVTGLTPDTDYRVEFELNKFGDGGSFTGTMRIDATSNGSGELVVELTYTSTFGGILMSDILYFSDVRIVPSSFPLCTEDLA